MSVRLRDMLSKFTNDYFAIEIGGVYSGKEGSVHTILNNAAYKQYLDRKVEYLSILKVKGEPLLHIELKQEG